MNSVSGASYIGSVDQNSSFNKRADDAGGGNSFYAIENAGTPLSGSTGLLVNTVTSSGNFYYAVTTSDGSGENTSLTVGGNSLNSAVSESVNLPEPVLQDAETGHYVLWVNFYDTPLIPAMGNRASMTYNFITSNITTSMSQILTVGLYGGSNDYTSKILKLNSDEFKLAFDNPRPDLFAPEPTGQDDSVNPLNTCWYGYGEDYSSGDTLTSGTVPNYTQRYMIYVIKWVLRTWSHVDEDRVYLVGQFIWRYGNGIVGFCFSLYVCRYLGKCSAF